MITPFDQWPSWLQILIMVPNGLFGTIALLVWQPTNDKEVRRYGFAITYLLTFLLVMVYLFHFHFRHAAPEP